VNLHAGLVALYLGGGWRGVLIAGPSGAGKSDLALRTLDHGFRLVADDRTILWRSGGRLYGRAPDVLHGLIEVRGLDVLRRPALAFAGVDLAVSCLGADQATERIPEASHVDHLGLSLPQISLRACEASAPAKLRVALEHLGGGAERAYQAGRTARRTVESGGDGS
jgi:serine kinase of HPr protein (carbohydrate metabolism regulator)